LESSGIFKILRVRRTPANWSTRNSWKGQFWSCKTTRKSGI